MGSDGLPANSFCGLTSSSVQDVIDSEAVNAIKMM